jgi:hypothetical protein
VENCPTDLSPSRKKRTREKKDGREGGREGSTLEAETGG